MEQAVMWITTIGVGLALVAGVWYYASLGKRISKEEKKADRDLSYEINPFTGSADKQNRNHDR